MTKYRGVYEDNTLQVLRVLSETPAVSQREVATRTQISLGAVNYCLRALIDKGQIKIHNFINARNRRAYAYILTPKGAAEKLRLTRKLLQHKLEEFNALQAELEKMEEELKSSRLDKATNK